MFKKCIAYDDDKLIIIITFTMIFLILRRKKNKIQARWNMPAGSLINHLSHQHCYYIEYFIYLVN